MLVKVGAAGISKPVINKACETFTSRTGGAVFESQLPIKTVKDITKISPTTNL